MAIAASQKTSGGSTTNAQQNYTTASTTPVAGALYLFCILAYDADSAQPPTPTVTGTNGYNVTWTLIQKNDFDPVATAQGTIFVFRGVASSAVAGTITANFGAATIDACSFALEEVTGQDTTTPVPQVSANETDGVSPETFNSLGAMVNADSRAFAVRGKNQNSASIYTVEAGWAKLSELTQASPSLHMTVAWSNTAGADTGTAWTHALGSLATGGFMFEVAAAAAAAAAPMFHQAGRSIYPGPSTA